MAAGDTPFVPLEVHSMYSLGEGTLHPKEIFSLASGNGDAYISVADTNSFAGLVNLWQEAKDRGVKLLIAARLVQANLSALLVARTMQGYGNICHLISQVNLDPHFSLEKELTTRAPVDCFLITKHRGILAARHPGTFVEINPYQPGYGDTYRLSKSLDLPPVLVPPVYFRGADDFETHRALCAIAHNKNLWDLKEGETQSPEAYYPARGPKRHRLISRFAPMEDAIANTAHIAQSAHFEFPLGALHFPKLEGDSFERLRSKCLKNAPFRYGSLTPAVDQRLTHELAIIRKKGFCDYFLVVEDIVRHAGMFTCGRGSGAASIVSYLLFITHVDPLAHNLYFERFLNEARPDPPDIDIDFAWDEKDRITQYVFEAHGQKCARVSNHIHFSKRSAFHEVAKLFGIPEREIMAASKDLDAYYDKKNNTFVEVGGRQIGSQTRHTWAKIGTLVGQLEGLPRHLGLHCGGTVVVPHDISGYAPVYMSAKGFPAIQWEKDQTEDFGLVKIDLLGNRSLAVVRDTLKAIHVNEGLEIKYELLNPIHDQPTIDALARGDSLGVFYVESPAMRQLQKKTNAGDYEHLVIHSSIIRPAANNLINEYVRRLKGAPWTPLLPEMGEILAETYGIMVYQEDISKVAVAVAGFSVGEGEELRKVIGNARKAQRRKELRDKLFANMAARSIEPDLIETIWDMIESFAGYSFCKPHSASYAQLSFKACYLKVHHPAEFMAAVLSNQGGFYGPSAYIAEARRLGLSVLGPDINDSDYHYRGNLKSLWVGFMVIKDLSSKTVDLLLKDRVARGPFTGLSDFMARTQASLIETRLLIRAGCFDKLEGGAHPRLLFAAAKFDALRGANGMLPMEAIAIDALAGGLSFKTPSWEERKEEELFTFGFIVSVHPMIYWGHKHAMPHRLLARDAPRHVGRLVTYYGVLITTKTVKTIRDDLMKFVTFEDESDLIECVMFPEAYEKYGRFLEVLAPYRITGHMTSDFDACILQVTELARLDQRKKAPRKAPLTSPQAP